MIRRVALSVLLLVLVVGALAILFPHPALPQGVGIYVRALCSTLTLPVVGNTFCFDTARNALFAWNGVRWNSDVSQITGVHHVLDYGAVCDGVTDDSAAFQLAIATASATTGERGMIVAVPPGRRCNLGTTSLRTQHPNTAFIGGGGDSSTLLFQGTGVASCAIINADLTVRARMLVSNLGIALQDPNGVAVDNSCALEYSYWSNSRIARTFLTIKGTNNIGFRGAGTVARSSPFYNVFEQNDIQCDNSAGVTTGSIGYALLQTGTSVAAGPNANEYHAGRTSSCSTTARMMDGNGNIFSNIVSESVTVVHYWFGKVAASASGTRSNDATLAACGSTCEGGNRFLDASAAWGVNTFANGVISITGGTGAGQSRVIGSNSATQVILNLNWQTYPTSSSTYAIWPADVTKTTLIGGHVEGQASSVPTFLKEEPGARGVKVEHNDVGSLGGGADLSTVVYRPEGIYHLNGRRDLSCYTFALATYTAVTATSMLSNGQSTVFIPYDADILGLSIRASSALTNGRMLVNVQVNGASAAITNRLDATVTQQNTAMQPIGTETLGGATNNRLGIQFTNERASSSTNNAITATVCVGQK